MKIDRIISSVNSNPTYLTFAPAVCEIWEKISGIKPTIAFIRSGNSYSDYIVSQYLKDLDVIEFDPIKTIDSGIQSKITRMYLASSLSGNNIITDIDMIPLSVNFLKCYDLVPDDHLAKFGGEHESFQKKPDIGKWPMHGTAASSETFKKIVNPSNLDYEQLLQSWRGFPQDPRSNVYNRFSNFSDESLLKCMFDFWEERNTKTTEIKREDVDGNYESKSVYGRLCRSSGKAIETEILSKYYECHGPRPFHEHLDFYKKITKSLETA